MDFGLSGKTAIVTGGNRGIGRATALDLAAEGASVCLAARTAETLDAVAAEVEKAGGASLAVAADLGGAEGCRKVVEACVSKFGGVDILVNCAGAGMGGDILQLPVEVIDDAIGPKFYGYLRMAQLAVPHMQKKRWGRIVFVAGNAAVLPNPGNLPTSVTNMSIHIMTRSLADAVSKDNILVNVVSPGLTNTQRARDVMAPMAEKTGKDVEEVISNFGKSLPAGRIAEPEEVAKVVVFLSPEACSFMHANAIYTDGGMRRGPA